MSTKFSYVWDNETGCWQIISRSGHVVYESSNRSEVRQMCDHIQGLSTGPKLSSINEPLEVEHFDSDDDSDGEAMSVGNAWLSWPVMLSVLAVIGALAFTLVPSRSDGAKVVAAEGNLIPLSDGQRVCQQPVYQNVWQTEMRERTVRVAKPVYETVEQEQRSKVMRPVWETEEKEEVSVVKRPVVETSVRYEKYTVNEPVTTYEPQTVDQGQWVTQAVQAPTTTATRLRWVPGGYATDAATGVTSWKLPMFRFVQEPKPGVQQTFRVWQANPVTTQVPKLSYAQRVETRPINVQTVRYVEEKQVRKVPVKVQKMVEQEVVRKVPVTTCRVVYEDRVEQVPVKVCRRVQVNGQGQIDLAPQAQPAPQYQAAPLSTPKYEGQPQYQGQPTFEGQSPSQNASPYETNRQPQFEQPLPGPVDTDPTPEVESRVPSSQREKVSADRVVSYEKSSSKKSW